MQNNEKGRFFFILYTQQPQQQQQQISVKGTSEQSRRFTVQDVFGSGEFAVYTIPPPVDGIPFFFSCHIVHGTNQQAFLYHDEMAILIMTQKCWTRAKAAQGSMLARMGLLYIYNLTDYICQLIHSSPP
jgi:hypothetical protein